MQPARRSGSFNPDDYTTRRTFVALTTGMEETLARWAEIPIGTALVLPAFYMERRDRGEEHGVPEPDREDGGAGGLRRALRPEGTRPAERQQDDDPEDKAAPGRSVACEDDFLEVVTRLRPKAARQLRTTKAKPSGGPPRASRSANTVMVSHHAEGSPTDVARFFRSLAG